MTDREPLVPNEGLAPASEATIGAAGPLRDTLTTAPRSQWRNVWDQFTHHKGAMAGGIIFLLIVFAVFLGPFFWTLEATQIDIRARNQGPSLAHPFGTDQLGRDMLARMMEGGRTSVSVGIAAMLLALFVGSFVGVVAGYFRRLDSLLMRLTDLFLALPLLPLLLVMMLLFREPLSAAFGTEQGIFILIVCAIGMLAGFCGTLLTPMAANFNIVPAALLELDDQNGVIRQQIWTAIPLWGCNVAIIYLAGFWLWN